MWTQSNLVEDLENLGVRRGTSLLVHTSLRAIGKIDGGAETLVEAFREVLGQEGTLMVPTFTLDHIDPTSDEFRDASEQELTRMRALVPAYDIVAPSPCTRWTGVFPEIVRNQPDAVQSQHPVYSFAAIGANARFLTDNPPYHYPLGTNSPLARLHQIGGEILLIGTSHRVNASLHLAEIWADVPYIHRSSRVKVGGLVPSSSGSPTNTGHQEFEGQETIIGDDELGDDQENDGEWSTVRGIPTCSEGFYRIESVLQQARIIRSGTLGNASCQRMQQRATVSMAVAMLSGDGSSLLCTRPECEACALARKLTAEKM